MTSFPVSVRGGLVTLALVLAFAVTACGGSDSDGGAAPGAGESTAAAISKDDFLQQGNAICEAGNAKLSAALGDIDPTDIEAAKAAIADDLVPNVQGQIDDLRALGYPDGDQEALEGIYTGAEDALATISADPTSFLTDSTVLDDTNTALVDYGLTTCGSTS